jgi:Immunity protein 61
MTIIDRYFFGRFGGYIRSMNDLPRMLIRGAEEEISAGFSIDTRPFEGAERLALTASIDDITVASLDTNGRPLFTQAW